MIYLRKAVSRLCILFTYIGIEFLLLCWSAFEHPLAQQV